MIFQEVQYQYPYFAYLLFLIPLILALLWRLFIVRQRVIHGMVSSSLVDTLTQSRSVAIFWGKGVALCLVWGLAVLAMMAPISYGHYPPQLIQKGQAGQAGILKQKAHEVTLLIDASDSMSVADLFKKARFDVAKEIADEVIGGLRGESVSLYAFTSQLSQLAPATTDYLYTRLMLRQMEINEGGAEGTNFKNALEQLQKHILSLPPATLKTLVILSDGGDTRIESLGGQEKQKAIEELSHLFGNAQAENLHVVTVGAGSIPGGTIPNLTYKGAPVSSALQQGLLEQISRTGNGRYLLASAQSPVATAREILKEIEKPEAPTATRKVTVNLNESLIYDRYYQFPLGIAILLLGGILLWPDRLKKRGEV